MMRAALVLMMIPILGMSQDTFRLDELIVTPSGFDYRAEAAAIGDGSMTIEPNSSLDRVMRSITYDRAENRATLVTGNYDPTAGSGRVMLNVFNLIHAVEESAEKAKEVAVAEGGKAADVGMWGTTKQFGVDHPVITWSTVGTVAAGVLYAVKKDQDDDDDGDRALEPQAFAANSSGDIETQIHVTGSDNVLETNELDYKLITIGGSGNTIVVKKSPPEHSEE